MQKILNKTIMLTIPLSITLTSFAHANPSQEAQAFAAQFKKEPLKPKLTVEMYLINMPKIRIMLKIQM